MAVGAVILLTNYLTTKQYDCPAIRIIYTYSIVTLSVVWAIRVFCFLFLLCFVVFIVCVFVFFLFFCLLTKISSLYYRKIQ